MAARPQAPREHVVLLGLPQAARPNRLGPTPSADRLDPATGARA